MHELAVDVHDEVAIAFVEFLQHLDFRFPGIQARRRRA
jgi:hypothetical protein